VAVLNEKKKEKVSLGPDDKLSAHFRRKEFNCRCGRCSPAVVDGQIIKWLEAIRKKISLQRAKDTKITITSGKRCKKHNKKIGGHSKSKHVPDEKGEVKAVDFKIAELSGSDLENIARSVGVKAVGVASTWVHIDTRVDRDRRWEY